MRKIQLGPRTWTFPGENLGQLRSLNAANLSQKELQEEIDQNGYLFAKNIINRDDVLIAREAVLHHLENSKCLNKIEGQARACES